MNFVRALDLQRWADETDARGRLPQLLRRLIFASCFPLRVEFPTREDVQLAGWDGIVDVAEGNEFVPTGVSLWELSATKRTVEKATLDLAKRGENPLGFNKSETTVVVVTPRKWPTRTAKRSWEQQQATDGGWRAVRVMDAADLESWIERAPSVDWWLAFHLGLRPAGASDFRRHWEALASLSTHALRPSVFLSSRRRTAEALDKWVAEDPRSLAIEATSPEEALDFIAAWLATRERTEARSLLIESREAWRAVSGPGNAMLLVPHSLLQLEPELLAAAVAQGHHVLVPVHRSGKPLGAVLTLPIVRRPHLHESLRECGFGFEAAARHARETGGHLGVLKRRLSAAAGVQPLWSTPASASELSSLVLVGAWDEGNIADAAIIARLSGQDFTTVSGIAHRWREAIDAPLVCKGNHWRFTSREESWSLLARYLTEAQLRLFTETAVEVLSEANPRYDLPMSDRLYAGLHRQTLSHSYQLREGLTETLVLLAMHRESEGPRLADGVVVQLLQGADWKRWASLEMQLPLLAEAAPDAFLSAAENDLASAEPALVRLFREEDPSAWGASSPHTGLLWALEVLCWSPDFLSRASLVLAKLTRLDPGGKLCNRPGRSLRDTFLPWAPHTDATPEQRLQVIDRLLEYEPKTMWDLLFGLLPHIHDCTNPRAHPRWRDWADYELHQVPEQEYVDQILAIADRITTHAEETSDCWTQLIDDLERLPAPHIDAVLKRLHAIDPKTLSREQRRQLWDQLRKKVAWHRGCGDKPWALRANVTTTLHGIAKGLMPDDPLEATAWLFLPGAAIEFRDDSGDSSSRRHGLEAARVAALKTIFGRYGLTGVRSLAEQSLDGAEIGFHIAEQAIFSDDAAILPAGLVDANDRLRSFALGYAGGRFKIAGWDWIESLRVESWTTDQTAWIGRILKFEPATWRWFDKLGDEFRHAYWRRAWPWPGTLSVDELVEPLNSLLEHGRVHAAIDFLHSAKFQKMSVPHALIGRTLEEFLVTTEKAGSPDEARQTAWEIGELIEYLQEESKLPREQLARIEWGFVALLTTSERKPATLFSFLAESPQLFAEIIDAAYSGRAAANGDAAPRAENARDLLRTWRDLPAQQCGGGVDAAALQRWCEEARNECQRRNCGEVGDVMIGRLFANSKNEVDGSWPVIAVRDCMEKLGSDALERGFHTGAFNLRGLTCRNPGEGGDQERALAARFRGHADACKFRWPRTALILANLASGYEADAVRHDQRALDE